MSVDEKLLLRLTPAELDRVLRALDQTSAHLAGIPGGSRVATVYRALASDLRAQSADE